MGSSPATSKDIFNEIINAVIIGDSFKIKLLVEQALEKAIKPEAIIKEGLIPGMETVSAKFQSSEFYVVDVIVAANAMQTGVQVLKEKCCREKAFEAQSRVVIGTVEGDIHDLGKNIVALTLEGAGYEVIDLGVDVSPAQFVEAITKFHPDLVCISALLTVTMLNMQDVIEAIKEAGLRDRVKIIIGGAPVTQSFANKIGADAYVKYGTNVVQKVRELLEEEKNKKRSSLSFSSFVNRKHQEIFQKLFDIKPAFIDENGNVILKGEDFPTPCRECRKWFREHSFREENTAILLCSGGLAVIEASIELDHRKTGKIKCGPFRLSTSSKDCTPAIKELSRLELERVLTVVRLVGEQIGHKARERLLEAQITEQRESIIRSLKFQEELRNALNEANYRSLQSQVNPHFLFNSLNSLARLAMLEEAERTEKFAYALSRTLRYILRNIKGTVKIAEEIQMIRDYLFIQQVRFSDRISVNLEIEDSVSEGRIPCMVLQPIVENAIIHGLEPLEGKGRLEISGKKEGQTVFFEITDNGVGIPPHKLKEISHLNINRSGRGHATGLGLVHVHQRLQHYFGSNYGLEIQSQEGKGTSVKIYLPYIC